MKDFLLKATLAFAILFCGTSFLDAQNLLQKQAVSFQVDVVKTDVTCNGMSDGTAVLTITGDGGPYEVQWVASGNSGPVAMNLPAGANTYIVTDTSNGETVFEQVHILEPDPFLSLIHI